MDFNEVCMTEVSNIRKCVQYCSMIDLVIMMIRFVNNKCDKSILNSKIKEDRVETIFSRKLKELFTKYYCIDIRIVFTSFKVKNYFSLKCHTPLPLLANVVYKFKCLRDANNIYIGKTIRHLATRVKEHGTSPSAVFNHLSSCETCKSDFSCYSFF